MRGRRTPGRAAPVRTPAKTADPPTSVTSSPVTGSRPYSPILPNLRMSRKRTSRPSASSRTSRTYGSSGVVRRHDEQLAGHLQVDGQGGVARQLDDDELRPTADGLDPTAGDGRIERLGCVRPQGPCPRAAGAGDGRARGCAAAGRARRSRPREVRASRKPTRVSWRPAPRGPGPRRLPRRSASARVSGVIDSQSSPTLMSTVSGTSSGSAPSIVSRRSGTSRSTSSRGTSSSSSSWTWSSGRARKPPAASRSSSADHRDLDDVGGGPLDRHVDGHPLAGRAQRRVSCGELRDLPLPAEQRRHVALGPRLLLDREHVIADARIGREVGVDERLRLGPRDVGPLRQPEVRQPVGDARS